MSRKYKFHDPTRLYFATFTTIYWIDALTRNEYRDIVIDSLRYCQKHKGLEVYAFCIMCMSALVRKSKKLEGLFRDLKQFTAKRMLSAIAENPKKS